MHDQGYDVVGDVHGCRLELERLLDDLGYRCHDGHWLRPEGRQLVLLGDLVDRGPDNVGTLFLADALVQDGVAVLGALGNHDWRLYQALVLGQEPVRRGGLPQTLEEIDRAEETSPGTRQRLIAVIDLLFGAGPAYSTLAGGRLFCTHGAFSPAMAGLPWSSGREDHLALLCMTGETDGQVDARGRPVRTFGWVARWQEDEETTVVFGHNVCGPLPQRYGTMGRVIGLDTGCVFGGALSCYRWPEDEFVCIAAARAYSDDVPVLVDAALVSRSVEARIVS